MIRFFYTPSKRNAKKEGKGWESYTGEIVIANTNYEMIHRIKMLWDGKINIQKNRNEKWKDAYRWTISNRKSITNFIENIFPYLITKKKQALLVLTLLGRTSNRIGWLPRREGRSGKRISDLERGIRRQLYLECQRLNKRGKKK